jgi:tetratricopeptide (TPR) repeat protein
MNARLDIGERQFQRAREALEKYLAVVPDDPEAHYLMGETYRRAAPLGPEFEHCQAAYQAALEQDSAFAPALKELGMTYRLQRQNAAARDAFKQYLAYAEDAPDAGIIRAYLEAL